MPNPLTHKQSILIGRLIATLSDLAALNTDELPMLDTDEYRRLARAVAHHALPYFQNSRRPASPRTDRELVQLGSGIMMGILLAVEHS